MCPSTRQAFHLIIRYETVKPRLGPAMMRIIGMGLVYLAGALTESFIRVLYPDFNHSNYVLIPNPILVLTDSVIMWWSFSYLIQTIKEMRIRHNVVKFNLYRDFSNILIIVIVASVLFMAWFLYKSTKCITIGDLVKTHTDEWTAMKLLQRDIKHDMCILFLCILYTDQIMKAQEQNKELKMVQEKELKEMKSLDATNYMFGVLLNKYIISRNDRKLKKKLKREFLETRTQW